MRTNEAFFQAKGIDPAQYQSILARMDTYGENRWWLSDEPKVRAYCQVVEICTSTFLILPQGRFLKDLEILLGRLPPHA